MKIKSGDKVKILSGKDRGKTGKVVQVLVDKARDRRLVVVEGINIMKKNIRTREKGKKGQIIELPSPIDFSKVMLIDEKSGKPTRVGFKIEGKEKKRVAKVSGELIV